MFRSFVFKGKLTQNWYFMSKWVQEAKSLTSFLYFSYMYLRPKVFPLECSRSLSTLQMNTGS